MRRFIHISNKLKSPPTSFAVAAPNNNVHKVYDEIKDNLQNWRRGEIGQNVNEASEIAKYYFDLQGKALRPRLSLLTASAANYHLGIERTEAMLEKQRAVALVTEMYHTASLLHDDVIDRADLRRGKKSVNVKFGQKKSIVSGDFAVAVATKLLSETRNIEVVRSVTRILRRLVEGELQQMAQGKKMSKHDRFQVYLDKTYNKTASLMALSCKAVTLIAEEESKIVVNAKRGKSSNPAEEAFMYGKNLGIAFQLMDDLLDFVSDSDDLGKPAAADLKLGLATAPVLFAREQFPKLERMIERKFSHSTDAEEAYLLVMNSTGLQETRFLAENYAKAAEKCIQEWKDCPEKEELIRLAHSVVERTK